MPLPRDSGSFPVLREGDTCWRIEHAGRLAVIVDAADYFRTVKAAMLRARHSILLIGWDFDTRIHLDPLGEAAGTAEPGIPDGLGAFLTWLADRRPALDIRILKWDLGAVRMLGRGTTVFRLLDWIWRRNISFRLDHAHPTGASHHQKIVVIDDALAFCGGIDMTGDRWDTREHRDDDPRRHRPTTHRAYGPWHDAATAVDGDAARAIGDHARERWRIASGETLAPSPPGSNPWPDALRPTLTDVSVGIARTVPAYGDQRQVREIESLFRHAILSARRNLYLESQYFASRIVAEAVAESLQRPDGPDIVLVNPQSADGWLEELAMDTARARLLGALKRADRYGRFRAYTPVTAAGKPIYVHAKIMVVDDCLLRVGSSNLNNRSMGFDTECDLAIEAGPDERDTRERIAAFRDDLLAEHLGCGAATFSETFARTGSLVATVEVLRGPGRSLRPLKPMPISEIETYLADNELLDPERPRSWRQIFTGRKLFRRRRLLSPAE